ncbi:MAG: hypothetical protein IPK20_21715 [Betaproteobacteria bacterium]|nr:hypothetical protein [Betaproteobacteria bacterium]
MWPQLAVHGLLGAQSDGPRAAVVAHDLLEPFPDRARAGFRSSWASGARNSSLRKSWSRACAVQAGVLDGDRGDVGQLHAKHGLVAVGGQPAG